MKNSFKLDLIDFEYRLIIIITILIIITCIYMYMHLSEMRDFFEKPLSYQNPKLQNCKSPRILIPSINLFFKWHNL